MAVIEVHDSRGYQTLRKYGYDHDFEDIGKALADFYVLERLEADGSATARRTLRDLEPRLARSLAVYTSMIVGGELRHLPFQHVEDDYYDTDPGCRCCCMECHNESGCRVRVDYDASRTPGGGWQENIPTPIVNYLERYVDGYGGAATRDQGWREWLEHLADQNPVKWLRWCGMAHQDGYWESGYGGDSWAEVAWITADYLDRMISDRVFINMVWSMEHNGGCIFDKVWQVVNYGAWESDFIMRKLLDAQANDHYDWLARRGSTLTRALWRVRPFYVSQRHERDITWLGIQPDMDLEVAW